MYDEETLRKVCDLAAQLAKEDGLKWQEMSPMDSNDYIREAEIKLKLR